MDKLSKVLFVLWTVLAIAAFIGAFWATPTIVRTLSIIFGIINMMIIMSWVSALIREKREIKKQQKRKEE
jgi:membrane protein implicated in regulation of membrane protease activity